MLWVLLIAVFVLLEKILPVTRLIRAGSGLALLVWGTYWLLSSSV
jgi:predicted metal-binding membrane protein